MNQHQDYDKIFKENVEKIGLRLLKKLFGLQLEKVEKADATLPRTLERRADYACIATDVVTQIRMIKHMEIQAKVHDFMDSRMLFYYALYYDLYHLPVKQYVIYIGNGKWTGKTKIEHENLNFSFEVIVLNTIDYNLFLDSDEPAEIILAILADFKGEKSADVIKKILTCLKKKTKNKRKLQKLVLQLEMLSNIRKLQPIVIKQLEDMSLNYDIQTDLRYLQGKEEGISKVIQQIVTTLLSKFPNWSDSEIAEVANTNMENVAAIRAERNKQN